jgi:hypothetical protein
MQRLSTAVCAMAAAATVTALSSGRGNARFESVAPVTNIDTGGVERADVHALTIRTSND